ncbi:MAG: peptidylprolyl isomerase [Betaproteobacteria bacterium]|nr:peptidylprolyl isomerase [Betaproteobacteria bacterium]
MKLKTFPDLIRPALAIAALLSATAAAAPLEVDRIVATVNNAVITRYELQQRLAQTLKQLEGQRLPGRKQLEQQVLERMVTEKALLQVAEDTSVRVDAAQLDRALGRIAQGNNLTLEAFRAALEKDGVPYSSFREQIRVEMVLGRLREREVENRVVITDAEIDNYLANPVAENTQQTAYNLSHIFIAIPEASSPEKLEEVRAKAEKALAELKSGADFTQVSAGYSDAQNALKGGSMGWRAEAQLPGLFASALAAMKQGEVSAVLRSPNGFHILRLNDKRGNFVQMLIKQTHARHILVKLNELVNDAEAKQRLLGLKERLEQGGAKFEELAKLNSDDLSASKGGDLGWLTPGDTVSEFERAMDSLKDGEVSGPIQSPFGWHLIQVLERREQDVTQDRKRLEARRALRERKSDEAFDDWVRQVRDRAYVEIRQED